MRNSHRKAPKSENVYLQVLVKLYRFLARMDSLPNSSPIIVCIAAIVKANHPGLKLIVS